MPVRKPRSKKAKKAAMKETMHEYKRGTLRSGSKDGPKVKDRGQAIAIGLNQSGQSTKKKSAGKRSKLSNVTF